MKFTYSSSSSNSLPIITALLFYSWRRQTGIWQTRLNFARIRQAPHTYSTTTFNRLVFSLMLYNDIDDKAHTHTVTMSSHATLPLLVHYHARHGTRRTSTGESLKSNNRSSNNYAGQVPSYYATVPSAASRQHLLTSNINWKSTVCCAYSVPELARKMTREWYASFSAGFDFRWTLIFEVLSWKFAHCS